jgi:hypothetical protein
LEAITEEARSNGLRPEDPPTAMFANSTEQSAYEKIRADGIRIWANLKTVTALEDAEAAGTYTESEKLLQELRDVNERYLRLAVPHLDQMLAPETKPDAAFALN